MGAQHWSPQVDFRGEGGSPPNPSGGLPPGAPRQSWIAVMQPGRLATARTASRQLIPCPCSLAHKACPHRPGKTARAGKKNSVSALSPHTRERGTLEDCPLI